jgi:hypothetical protein
MGQIVFQATLGGQTALVGQNTASSFSLNLPLANDTLVGKATTDTLTNKTLTSPTITGATLTTSAFNGTIGATTPSTAVVTSLTNSALTSGRVTYAGTGGLLQDSASLYFDGTNLGIGTSSPAAKLDVSGGSLRINEDGAGTKVITIRSNYAGVDPAINVTTNNGLLFLTNNTERMRINSSGDLLVGTSTGTTNGGYYFSVGSSSSFDTGHATGTASGTTFQRYTYAGSVIGSVSQSGTTAVLYNVTSDQRLKTNIVDAPSGNIDSIKVRSFDWISDNTHQIYGMVAQELLEVAPYAVHQPQDTKEMMAVDYSKLVPMMIKEIQDLKQRIATLESK